MILFYCNAMKELAAKIATNEKIILGNIDWDEFPDGFPNIFIRNVDVVRNADIAFLASFTPKTMFEQLAVIYALPKYGARSLKIILPYFPVGTMDRVSRIGEITTAKSLARQLSFIRGCPVELVIYDIHSMHEWHYFEGDINPRLESALPLLKNKLGFLRLHSNISVVFPDEGAFKRFEHMFKTDHDVVGRLREWDMILCHKERLGSKRRVKIIEGNPNGKDVVIVDDLVMTGGTLLECAKVLEQKGAKSVSAYVTHAVFPNRSWVNMKNFPFANFWITDSCPETLSDFRKGPEWNKFRILSLALPIAKILLR